MIRVNFFLIVILVISKLEVFIVLLFFLSLLYLKDDILIDFLVKFMIL